jgi:flagellar protein FlaG
MDVGASLPEPQPAASAEPEAVKVEISQRAAKAEEKPKAQMNLDQAVRDIQEYIKNLPSDLQFRADKESGYIICKVVNPVTREILRQYPPEELIELARRLRSLGNTESSGVFLDKEF